MKRTWLVLPLLSLILSGIGIWHGLPMHVVGDEEALIGGALKMIELKTLIPSLHPADFASLYYPPLISYSILIAIAPLVLVQFVALGFSLGAVQDYFSLNQNAIWISARLLSALFAAGMVTVVFHIAKRVWNEKVAWLSSLLLAFSFFHVVLSHWVRHWTFTTFFVYAAVLAWMWVVDRNVHNSPQPSLTLREGESKEIPPLKIRGGVGGVMKYFHSLLPALLGGLGFGVSYIGSLGFIVGLVYVWFKHENTKSQNHKITTPPNHSWVSPRHPLLRNPFIMEGQRGGLWKIVLSNVVVFGFLSIIFALLNIQEVYRMLSPVDGSLADPKSLTGFISTLRDMGLILVRQEVMPVFLALCSLFFVKKIWRHQSFVFFWLIVYTVLIYGAFHLELRYVYVMVPALCLLGGFTLSKIFDFFSVVVSGRTAWEAVVSERSNPVVPRETRDCQRSSLVNDKTRKTFAFIVVFIILLWPVVSVIRYETLLLRADTREQVIDWIEKNVQPNESFLLSSETVILPRSDDALRKDQEMGRIRAIERFKLNQQLTVNSQQKQFDYYNLHFWREDVTEGEIDEFMEKEQPRYFIVDYWSEEKLADRERNLMKQGRKIATFSQGGPSPSGNAVDVNGNFFVFNSILFQIDRFGPIVEIYKL